MNQYQVVKLKDITKKIGSGATPNVENLHMLRKGYL